MTTAVAPPLLEDTPIGPRAGGFYRHQNFGTGLAAGIVLGFIGWLVSHALVQGSNWGTDMVVTITMVAWVIGFNAGVGTFNAPFRWVMGHDQTHEDELYAAGVSEGKTRATGSSPPTTRWWGPSTSSWSCFCSAWAGSWP